MNTWHYRLIKHVYPKGEVYYAVHEYYPATEEVGDAWGFSPVELWGETSDDIRWIIARVRNDIGRLLDKHDIIEVKHDDYGVGYAEITGGKPCTMCGDKIEPLLKRIEELEAKLAKATDTLARIVRGDDDAHNWAIWTLGELKGGKDG